MLPSAIVSRLLFLLNDRGQIKNAVASLSLPLRHSRNKEFEQ